MQRSRRHIQGDVELNMAAMLDMAFQLLAFFILTFQPSPVEGCIALRMPPASPVTKPDQSQAGAASPDDAALLPSVTLQLQVTVTAGQNGGIAAIRIGERPPVSSLAVFEQDIKTLMKLSDVPFEQVLIRVGPTLEYENVLKVLEICARNKLTQGNEPTKVSIQEMP